MGLLSKSRKASGDVLYNDEVKPQLVEKDGNIHIVMINSFSKFANQAFGGESNYTEQICSLVKDLQKDG